MKKYFLAVLIMLSAFAGTTSSASEIDLQSVSRCEARAFHAAITEISRDSLQQDLKLVKVRRGRTGFLFKIYGAQHVYDMVVRHRGFTLEGDCNIIRVTGRFNRLDENARRNPAPESSGSSRGPDTWYDPGPQNAGYPSFR